MGNWTNNIITPYKLIILYDAISFYIIPVGAISYSGCHELNILFFLLNIISPISIALVPLVSSGMTLNW